MDRHTCKLCFRRFQNGRALGGHMRSHVMAAAAAAAAAAYSPASPPISLASTSSTEVDDDDKPKQQEPVSWVLHDSSRKSVIKEGATEFSGGLAVGAGESSIVQDGESDTESSPRGGARFAVSRRRSKRARRQRAPPPPPAAPAAPDPDQPASSVSDATPEEDVAMSLVMLSRDSWARSRSQHWAPAISEPEQNNDGVGLFDAGGEDEYDHDVAATAQQRPPRGSRFQCGACKKVFRSYQALGGHRASIKKGKGGCVVPPSPAPSKKATHHADAAAVVHECPFCFRVFASGQALGGHKRSHMLSSAAGASPSPAKCGDSSGSIDLNVPAAMDDDFELSAVYDAEFGGSTRQ